MAVIEMIRLAVPQFACVVAAAERLRPERGLWERAVALTEARAPPGLLEFPLVRCHLPVPQCCRPNAEEPLLRGILLKGTV